MHHFAVQLADELAGNRFVLELEAANQSTANLADSCVTAMMFPRGKEPKLSPRRTQTPRIPEQALLLKCKKDLAIQMHDPLLLT